MRETAELAESCSRLLEFDAGEGIGVGAVGADAEAIEKGLADQMRRVALHRPDTEIDAGLAEIHRLQLRMRIRDVQDARVAEALEIVDARTVSAARDARQLAGERGRARKFQEVPAADRHNSVSARRNSATGEFPSYLISKLSNFHVPPAFLLAGGLEDRGFCQCFGFPGGRRRLVEFAGI